MATLSDTIKARLQRKLAIGVAELTLDDDALADNYDLAAGDFDLTMVYCLRDMVMLAAKLHRYQVASASFDKQQVYDHLVNERNYWENRVSRRASQAVQVGLRPIPPREKDEPHG